MMRMSGKSALLTSLLIICHLIGQSTQTDEVYARVEENKPIGFIVKDLSVQRTLSNMCEVMKQTLSIDNSTTGTGRKVDVLDVKADGEVYIKNEIDREELCGKSQKCSLSLLIGDDDDFYLMFVEILDENDNKPYFPACNVSTSDCQLIVHVPESLELDTSVPVEHLRADDKDINENGKIFYRMTDQYFELVYIEGRMDLKLKKPLDFEKDSTHTFTLQALDGGLQRQLTSPIISVLVQVSNVNDHAPVFRKNPYKVNVNEGKEKGYVLEQVRAIDNDAKPYNELTYRLAKDNNDLAKELVEVKPDGKVVLRKPVDSKEHNGLEINIEVLDHLPENAETRYGETKLVVEVEDMNNNDPKINFIFSTKQNVVEEKSTGAVYIPEDIKPDAYFAVVEATDEDIGQNAMINLVVVPSTADDNIFELQKISSDVGHYQAKLMINTALDREKRKSYCVNVQACDQGSKKRCAVKRLNIELLDVNDNPPVFSSKELRVKVVENASIGEIVAQVQATDLDNSNPPVYMREGDHKVHSTNGDVTYTIVNGRGDFMVDAVSGEVKVDRELDREKNEQYHLTIVARDNGKDRQLESSMTLHITVLDINDNIPAIYQPERDENVYASTIKDQIIITIKATDEDRGSNGQLSFFMNEQLMNDEDLQLFKLDDKTGDLRLNFDLGPEKLKESLGPHSLSIEVRDHGKTVQKSTRNFMVMVIDTVIPIQHRKTSGPGIAGTNVNSIIVGVIIGIVLLLTIGLGFLWYRRCYMGRNKSCPINEKMDKHEHRELLHLDSYSNKDKNTNDSSSRASGEWKEANNINDNSRYDEMREVNVVNDELQMRKPSYSSNMTTFDPRSSNVSSMNTKITNLSSLTKQQECDSGRGDSSPDAVSHVEVAPFEQSHMSNTTSKDQVAMETVQQPMKLLRHNHRNNAEQEELGPYCTNTCLSHGHHDGCWINLTPMQPPSYLPAMHHDVNSTSPSSLYVDLYPPQIPQQYVDNSPAPSSGSRHFYPPYPTSTLTSIYSSVLAPEQQPQQRHYPQQRELYGVSIPARPSSALPHKQNRIHTTPSSSSSVSANHQQQRRYNNRFDQHIGYNLPSSPGMEPQRPANVHNKFRRSASTDAILRGGGSSSDHHQHQMMSSPTSPVAAGGNKEDGGETKITMRQTRAIVANIEKLLSDE